MVSFDAPWALALLPLALLPLWPALGAVATAGANSWAALFAPADRASALLGWALRLVTASALALLAVSVAGPYRPEYTVERVGRGAEIVLLLDRSRSMDQRFAGARPAAGAPRGTGPEALDYYSRLRDAGDAEPKGRVARRLLAEFAARRDEDRFALVAFSGIPIRVLDFTDKQAVIQAAISAGNVGRGLSETDIGLALSAALELFDGRPYTGSRSVLLVSDGGDHIDAEARERIAAQARKLRVSLYWVYIRSMSSPGLPADGAATAAAAAAPAAPSQAVPEHELHRFLQSVGVAYRAFEAENPQALQRAIAEVDRLERLPITTHDTVPRRELAAWCHAAALVCVLVLLAASRFEIGDAEPVPAR